MKSAISIRHLCVMALPILLLMNTTLLKAQSNGQLTGVVLDAEYNLTLPGANVILVEINKGVATDATGEFRLIGIETGSYTLRVSYIGYQTRQITVSVSAGQTTDVEITLEPGVINANQEVVVLGDGLRGQALALNQQKNNANITNVVASDQIGRFPDANIGDALKRIPGITTQVDQGEARFGLMRGTAPRLNSVTINGERIPSAEAETRTVQLDLVPADMIQAIEVNKAVTPDMAADAIGASVNLVTRAAPNGLRISGTLGSGYNFLRNEPIMLGSMVIGNRFAQDKLGVIVSASIQDHKLGSHNIEAEWADGELDAFEVRLYEIQRLRRSVSTTIDYELNPENTITFKGMYNHRDDWENRFRTVYERFKDNGNGTATARVRQQTKGGIGNDRVDYRRLEDQRAMTYSLNGDHQFGNLELNWMAGYAKASEERPNERYIRFQASNFLINYDPSNTEFPGIGMVNPTDAASFKFNELTEEYQYTEDIDRTFKADFTLPYADAGSYLKFGGSVKSKDKSRENNFFEYSPTDAYEASVATMAATGAVIDKTLENYEAGDYASGVFASTKYLGELNLKNSSNWEESDLPEEYLAGNFDATETVTSAYAMTNVQVNDQLSVIAGLRLEATTIDYTGNQLVFDADGDYDANASRLGLQNSQNYSNVLPGLHARFLVDENTVIRVAWTNTIARPNYYDLVPYRQVNIEDMELAAGNPELKPTTSMNFDVMAERYLSNVGLISGGVFFKQINDFAYVFVDRDYSEGGTVYDKFFQPRNGDGASLFGAELAVQRQLDFLPGFLRNFGVYANYTYVSTTADGIRNADGEVRNDVDLPGTAENTVNLSLSYETAKFSSRISYNFTSNYIDELGDEAQYDRYYDDQTFVDANASYKFTPKLRFFMEANNLTNQPLRYFQGERRFMMQEEYYSVRFNAGVKFDF